MPEHKYHYLSKEHVWTTKNLEIIEGEVPEGLTLVGTGVGISFQHCVFEGILHTPDFLKRIVAFRVEGQDELTQVLEDELSLIGKTANYVSISFYERGEGS